MRKCTDCQYCDPRGINNYCLVKCYFVSVQAIWCKSFKLSSEIRRNEVGEWLNTQGYSIELTSDGLWMEEFDFTEHKTKDVIDLILAWEDKCLNKTKHTQENNQSKFECSRFNSPTKLFNCNTKEDAEDMYFTLYNCYPLIVKKIVKNGTK
jgi:hypothetical protein